MYMRFALVVTLLAVAATSHAAEYAGTAIQDREPVYNGYHPFNCDPTDTVTISVNGDQLIFTDGHGRKATATIGKDGKFAGEGRDPNSVLAVAGQLDGSSISGTDQLTGRSLTCHKSFVAAPK